MNRICTDVSAVSNFGLHYLACHKSLTILISHSVRLEQYIRGRVKDNENVPDERHIFEVETRLHSRRAVQTKPQL